MEKEYYLAIDIGGSWLKGVLIGVAKGIPLASIPDMVQKTPVIRVKSRLSPKTVSEEFIEVLDELLLKCNPERKKISGLGISTAGVVDYFGKKLLLAASHLKVLTGNEWIDHLKKRTGSTVVLINDADAAAIGAAQKGYLNGDQIIGIMPVGTGLGFTVWRNGRKWTTNFSMTLLGCMYTPVGVYDNLASASQLAEADQKHDLCAVLSKPEHEEVRKKYLQDLAGIISSSHILYGINKVLIGGGLSEAAVTAAYPLSEKLKEQLITEPILSSHSVDVEIMPEGNFLPLIGAIMLALGEKEAQAARWNRKYSEFPTEIPYNSKLHLEEITTNNLIELLWNSEQEAGVSLKESLPDIGKVADIVIKKLRGGGRLIYIGSGTSGRLAAIDNVELGCTFGFPRNRVLTFISGGVADAAIDIESGFEEDASSVPELLLANITAQDVIIGISVSGSTYYVQSGLGFAKFAGAYTVMILEQKETALPFCHKVISLRSGNEIVAGSTRMKAGTATKKVLNFLSTTAMIHLGKVHGCYMIEMECINEKLISRAQHILQALYGMSLEKAYDLLKENNFHLYQVIEKIAK